MRQIPVYPFGTMKVGEAFDITHTTSISAARAMAAYYGKKHGRRFKVWTTPEPFVFEVERLPDEAPRPVVGVKTPRPRASGTTGQAEISTRVAQAGEALRQHEALVKAAQAKVKSGAMTMAEYVALLDELYGEP